MKVYLNSLFGNKFDSYSEFYLALELANVLHNLKGIVTDANGIDIDWSTLPKIAKDYFKYQAREGYMRYSGDLDTTPDVDEDLCMNVDVSFFKSEKVFTKKDGVTYWSYQYAQKEYSQANWLTFRNKNTLAFSMIALVAYYIAECLVNQDRFTDSDMLVLDIYDDMYVKNVYGYINIYSCIRTLDWLKSMVRLDVDTDEVDMDYRVFCMNAHMSGKIKDYSVSEKVDLLEKLGMREGSILLLFERKGMCPNNRFGKIESSKVIRLDEIGDNFIGYTSIALNKTKEETYRDYLDIDENMRNLFSDILTKGPSQMSNVATLYNMGIDEYFGEDDEYLITKIDPYAQVSKLITIDGEVGVVDMSEINAIYWLLCQYDVEFDHDGFREMYSSDEMLLWDKYGSSVGYEE